MQGRVLTARGACPGGEIPVDKKSRGEGFYTEDAKKFDADKEATAALKASKALADVNPGDYVAIYLPGGHGTVVDFPDSKELIAAINSTYADGAVVGAVCHGPMGLVNCKKPNGEALVKGLEVCSFTDSEEKVMGLTEKVPFLLESKMRSLGAKFKTGADWGSNAVADSSGAGVLVTGQNPASSKAVADLVVKALQK